MDVDRRLTTGRAVVIDDVPPRVSMALLLLQISGKQQHAQDDLFICARL